jgi:hypothetical protein
VKPFAAWQVDWRRIAYQETGKMLSTILIVILILLLIGAFRLGPTAPAGVMARAGFWAPS